MAYRYIISGIGTDVGKTIVSAIIAQRLQASYWKPIQSGGLDQTDSLTVGKLTSGVEIIPERYLLKEPLSPHVAARLDGVVIDAKELNLPERERLVVEGAGGIMVPFNYSGETFLDLFKKWQLPVILVSRHYLGSINHTLTSIYTLINEGIQIQGIIFVGDENKDTEQVIVDHSGLAMIGRIPLTEKISREFIVEQAERLSL